VKPTYLIKKGLEALRVKINGIPKWEKGGRKI
jgi:hypothetical protein